MTQKRGCLAVASVFSGRRESCDDVCSPVDDVDESIHGFPDVFVRNDSLVSRQ